MYTKEYLSGLSLHTLRNLDIKSREDEVLVQAAVNEKVALVPDSNPIMATSGQTDNMTPEKEKALQETLDAKRALKRGLDLIPEVTLPEEPVKKAKKTK